MSDRPEVPATILEAVKDIEPVGEFGSNAWCAACAAGGVKLLKEANLPEDMEWAFSEVYTHAPERFHADGREIVGYYMLVKNGDVTGGDGAPEEVRNTVGFNITARWAAICSPARVLYDGVGSKQRMEESEVMFAAIVVVAAIFVTFDPENGTMMFAGYPLSSLYNSSAPASPKEAAG